VTTPTLASVLLLSGGIDSTAVLVEYHDRITRCLFVDYGQPAVVEEKRAASRMADRFGIEFLVATVRGMNLGSMSDAPGVPGARVVVGRNAVLISLAANVAGVGGDVWIGCHLDDFEEYHDCREEWLFQMMAALKMGYNVRVRAPFASLPKASVRAKLASQQIEFSNLWSCYAPQAPDVPCGTCNSCKAAAQ
jgi:7-cyano-7-deazaguanine synthase